MLHFRPSDFRLSVTGRHSLKDEAIPLIFPWLEVSAKRKSPCKRLFSSSRTTEMSWSSEINIDNDQPAIARDVKVELRLYISRLEAERESLLLENNNLSNTVDELVKDQFGIAKFKDSDSDINFYTGFPDYQTLMTCYNLLNPGENGKDIVYNLSANDNLTFPTPNFKNQENPGNKPCRRWKLNSLDEFFIVLVSMTLGLFEVDFAHRFGVRASTVNKICISWIIFMYLKLQYLNIWADRDTTDKAMPQSFKDKYSKTRVIIDGIETKCQTPSSLVLRSETYSTYKSNTTFKGLIGIAPSGHITFISQLYAGSISHMELAVRSGILKLHFYDSYIVMANKGFKISDLLEPTGVGFNIPPFVGSRGQLESSQVITKPAIASEGINVERAMTK